MAVTLRRVVCVLLSRIRARVLFGSKLFLRKSDPTLSGRRNFGMLLKRTFDANPNGRPDLYNRGVTVLDKAGKDAQKDVADRDVTKTKPAAGATLSQETLWMLAVRDHRDKQAFAHLFDHFAPRLKGLFIRNGMSAAQAEDILQDTMLSVWRKAAQFDPARAQVSGWIYQVARNRQIDIIRKEKRPIPEALKMDDTTEPDASDAVALEQETRKLRDALNSLPKDQRVVLEKAYLGELTHKDIQTETGLPLGTIKSRIRLGLERLRHEFSKTEGGA